MRHPWVNSALLAFCLLQLVSGYFGFTNGRFERAWLLWLHGIGAYGILFIFIYKGQVIFAVWQRGGRWTRRRIGFLLLLGLLLLTLVSGLLWSFDGPHYLAGFSLVTLHIFLALAVTALLIWHTWRMRWIWRRVESRNRRAFLLGSGGLTAGLFLWLGARQGRLWAQLPGAQRRFTGSYEVGSGTGRFPTVSWIADRPPPIASGSWSLAVEGAVARPRRLDWAAISALPSEQRTAVLDCTGGWYTRQMWEGISLHTLLAEADPLPGAQSVTLIAVSGYSRRFPMALARSLLLAWSVAGQPLTHGHGAPLRLVAPGYRGVNWVKWVVRIEVETTPAWLQLPLPIQ